MNPRLALPAVVLAVSSATGACATLGSGFNAREPSAERRAVLSRAQIWTRTSIPDRNLKTGPAVAGSFPFRATVRCDYVDKKLEGGSPKFACVTGAKDELKVKYGGANGEVYGEVLATRLLWALGFGADAMYPVRVICRGCPRALNGNTLEDGNTLENTGHFVFDPASIERKMPGAEFPGDEGWS